MEYRILGPLEVWDDGRPVGVGGGRQRTLLALLLLHANEVVTRERLIDALWPEHPPESADKIVQNHVSTLRKVLPDEVLQTRGRGYQLSVGGEELDLTSFQALVREGRRLLGDGSPLGASSAFGAALALWRGQAFADCDLDSSARAESAALGELRLAALEERITADLAAGRHADLVGELESLVAGHPYRERFREQLMLALYRSGRPADALAAYRVAQKTLSGELGLEPSPSLRQLEKAILTQDPALDPPMPAVSEQGPAPAVTRRPRRTAAAAALIGLIIAGIVIAVIVLGDGSSGGSSIELTPNTVAVIDPASNKVVGSVPVGVRPDAVAVGEGAIWVTNLDDRSLTRIDPDTRTVVRTIPLSATPTGVAVGANAVWVANGLNGSLTRVEPGNNTPSITIPVTQRSSDGSVTVASGAVWTAYGDGSVVKVNPHLNRIVARGLAGFGPSAIASGEGSVWIANAGENSISRLNLRTRTSFAITVGSRPVAVAVGGGAVWVANQGGDSVTKVDPGTSSVADTFPVGDGPRGVVSAAGALWVANSEAGTVERLNPATGKVDAAIDVGNRPVAIAFGDGSSGSPCRLRRDRRLLETTAARSR